MIRNLIQKLSVKVYAIVYNSKRRKALLNSLLNFVINKPGKKLKRKWGKKEKKRKKWIKNEKKTMKN